MLVLKTIDASARNIEKEVNKFLSTTPLSIENIKFSTTIWQGRIFVSIIYEVK